MSERLNTSRNNEQPRIEYWAMPDGGLLKADGDKSPESIMNSPKFINGRLEKDVENSLYDAYSDKLTKIQTEIKDTGSTYDPDEPQKLSYMIKLIRGSSYLKELPENNGKTFDHILEIMSAERQAKIESLADSDNSAIETLVFERNAIDDLIANFRDTKKFMSEQYKAGDNKEMESTLRRINIGDVFDSLSSEIAQQEEGLKVLQSRDQRDYGNQTENAALNLTRKRTDAKVLDALITESGYEDNIDADFASKYLEKFISSRESIVANLTEQRKNTPKGSDENKRLFKRMIALSKDIDGARRVMTDYLHLAK